MTRNEEYFENPSYFRIFANPTLTVGGSFGEIPELV
jgi:hypothetical protein